MDIGNTKRLDDEQLQDAAGGLAQAIREGGRAGLVRLHGTGMPKDLHHLNSEGLNAAEADAGACDMQIHLDPRTKRPEI